MGMIRVNVAATLSICFFKITSVWYLCSGHDLPLLIFIFKRCAWHPFSWVWRIAHDSPPYARRNGDVSISTLFDDSL